MMRQRDVRDAVAKANNCKECENRARSPQLYDGSVITKNSPYEWTRNCERCSRMMSDWLAECDDADFDEARVMARIDAMLVVRSSF